MASPRLHSVHWWLGALVLSVSVPLLCVVVVLGVLQVRREQQQAREAALRMTRATAAHLRAMHKESAALLARLAARPGVAALEPAACRSEFTVVDFLPRYADLFLFDASGSLVCSGNTDPQNAAISALARPWIAQELRAGRLRTSSLVMHTFGNQTMTVMANEIGARSGTVVLLEFAEALGREAFVPGSVITILDRNETVVARSEASEEWSGRNIRGSGIARIGLHGDEGMAAARGLDGVSRQYAFVRVPELGWTVYGGVPSSAIAAPIREVIVNGTVAVVGSVIILTIMTFALARGIVRPMRALAAAATAVGDGVYARVRAAEGPREVAAMADAFNDMIDRREAADVRMKALSERLLTVQEEERTRIARELHDDLGQSLTALKMDVVGLLQATAQPPALAPIRDRILRTLDSTVTSVQRISSELRPSVLDDLGLVAAIDAEAQLFEERSGIECEVSVAGEMPVDSDSLTAIYRIIQEALTNVARHANATRTELRLRNRGDELLLEIRDDGRGVTNEEISDPLSLGLIGIRERAAVIGGAVQIEGVTGRGTIVSVRIPLAAKARLA